MNLLQIGILVFCFIETLNIIILYFKPNSTMGNGVGVFDSYNELIEDPKSTEFIKYLTNWVAGCKLIFIMVGIVVVIFGNYNTQIFTVLALIISILSFYWRLFPAIKRLDKANRISPKGYSKTLNYMIMAFVLGFSIILIIEIFKNLL
ncbi:MAG: hypothetical protein JEZ05_03195 [Tenericutes bacterium]|nr:hypothetical protein [Mycoplasmatota bacterium]